MKHLTTDDGRVLTPPKELEPLLKSAYPVFFKMLGHIRFFYVADEIWDGKTSPVFNTNGNQLAAITLDEGTFHLHIAMDRHCYHGVKDGWGEGVFSPSYCEGKQGCYTKTYSCLEKKGIKNCLECGEYHT